MITPDHPAIKHACIKARLAFDQGNPQDALSILDVADLQIDGDKPIMMLHRAEFQLLTGDQEAALVTMSQALNSAPYSGSVHKYVRALLDVCEESDAVSAIALNLEACIAASPVVWSFATRPASDQRQAPQLAS